MPELPEAETLRRGLAARITGLRITALEVLDRKISGGPGDAIKRDVVDHQISRVARRGKVLILFLHEPGSGAGEPGSLLIHPKMTGQLVLTSDGATMFAGGHPTPSMLRPMPNATTRAVFRLGPACCLYHNDARRLARRTCSAGRACPATCAARRSSAPQSRAARPTSARTASNAKAE